MGEELRAACVVGWPVEHSRSPAIHNHWLRVLGIPGAYRREAVRPGDLPAFLAGLAARGYVGCNLTVPHKETALELAQADARARAVGAANTLWLDGANLRATNTDADGFIANLDRQAPGWDRMAGKAVVLGAGGAARAVVYGLVERGAAPILVLNRTPARAQALARAFGPRVEAATWDGLPAALAGARLLVNATSLGMQGAPRLDIDLAPLASDAVVADIVYAPLETPLLAAAGRAGLRTVDGLGMLLHQAVGGFALWFGVRPEVTSELRRVIERDLAGGPVGGERRMA